MGSSFSRSLRAVWMARWQELAPQLRFWLLLAGYDVRDRSRSDIFYLPYLVAFWLVWAFAMFTAISGVLAAALVAVNPGAPAQAVVAVTLWALLLWALFTLYRVTRRSPFSFSPADAVLLCQTPVDRRAVGLIWFLSEWPRRFLPFAFVALAGGFSLYEVNHVIESVNLPEVFGYWQEGLRGLSIVFPIHFLLLALLWAVGAWRLHGRRAPRFLRWLPPLVTLLVLPLLLSASAAGPFSLPGTTLWQAVTWPLQAAFGQARWLPAQLAGLVAALAGFGVLLLATRALNLSRAAQETSQLYEERFLGRAGVKQEARRRQQERQLGATGRTTRMAGTGWWASLGKDMSRTARSWRSALWPWLGLFALSFAVVIAPDWGTRLVAFVFWVQVAANRSVARLGDNLSHWWLWRQQPFPAWQLVAASLAPPLLLLLLLTLAAGVIGAQVPLFPNFPVAPLLPFLSAVVAMVAAWDLLRKADPARLLMGDKPGVSVLGWFLGLALVGVALGFAWFVARSTNFWWPGLGGAALLCLGAAALLWSQIRQRAGRLA